MTQDDAEFEEIMDLHVTGILRSKGWLIESSGQLDRWYGEAVAQKAVGLLQAGLDLLSLNGRYEVRRDEEDDFVIDIYEVATRSHVVGIYGMNIERQVVHQKVKAPGYAVYVLVSTPATRYEPGDVSDKVLRECERIEEAVKHCLLALTWYLLDAVVQLPFPEADGR